MMSNSNATLGENFFERSKLLLGDENFAKLTGAHILIVGVGGVGSYVAETIARAGVGKITLVDGDTVDATNCNRQLPALSSTLGELKTAVVGARLRAINPGAEIIEKPIFIENNLVDELLDETQYDYIVDAIDSLTPKTQLICGALSRKIPLISSMGSGGRLDPLQLQICDISKTHSCALAKAVRKKLAESGLRKGVEVVFSPELVNPAAVHKSNPEQGVFRSYVGTISYL
ncbi:MAG: tRNA threonylcarbamoyladenosine dehydratase, partial [Victivallaceae bacterium]